MNTSQVLIQNECSSLYCFPKEFEITGYLPSQRNKKAKAKNEIRDGLCRK